MRHHFTQWCLRDFRFGFRTCLAIFLSLAAVSCTQQVSTPFVPLNLPDTFDHESSAAPTLATAEPIQVVRRLQDVANHRVDRSGDYSVVWSFSLVHPAQIPLAVTQHYESTAEIQCGTTQVVSKAAYTEIVGIIPVKQTRPIIAGTSAAVGALLAYTRDHPATPMALPSREQLQAFANQQIELASVVERPRVAAFYATALVAFDVDEEDMCDHWSFSGAKVATVGWANISGRVTLYEATPELLQELDGWDDTGGRECFERDQLEIKREDFDQIFQTAQPSSGMGGGGSGDWLSCSDHDGGAECLAHFKQLYHEPAPKQLTVKWKETDQPVLRINS